VKVEVVRSPRRRKTIQAREVGGVLRVSIPASMSKSEEERWVAEMLRRLSRRAAAGTVDLTERAAALARRYGLREPTAIRWSDNQAWRWGSATPSSGAVRISSRLATEPGWVLDYVIVHELAHLDVARHDRRFWALVNRYPLAERARGFLIARSSDPAAQPSAGSPPPADSAPADSAPADSAPADPPPADPPSGAPRRPPSSTRRPGRATAAAARSRSGSRT
jgi:predicted metal-dependent hydrolase